MKNNSLSAEDFVKAININIDALISSIKEKDDTTSIMTSMMLEFTKNFINEFVETAVVKTEDEVDSSEDEEPAALDYTQPTDLPGTIPFMTSDDYKNRFKAEYFQLSIRIDKLEHMLESYKLNALDFTPACPESLLELQLKLMKEYLAILEARTRIEDITF